MANPTVEQVSKASADALAKSVHALEDTVSESSSTLAESGKGSAAAVQELTKAYRGWRR